MLDFISFLIHSNDMVKKLIALISTENKSLEQIFEELKEALAKYEQIEEKVFREEMEKKKVENSKTVRYFSIVGYPRKRE